jgi:hypothetical protein
MLSFRGVELNPVTQSYEVRCTYKQQATWREAAWTEIHIRTPQQWIELLTQCDPDDDDLELP